MAYTDPTKQAYGEEDLLQDALTEFITKWKLSDESQELFYSLPSEVQHKVILEFSPRDADRDANAIFLKFARGVSQAHLSGDEMNAFIAQWNLGPEATQLLTGMDASARAKVLREFSPRDTSSDVNNIFIRFAQGVAKGTPRAGKGAFGAGPAPASFGKGKVAQPMQHVPFYPQAGQAASGSILTDPVLVQFVTRWNLKEIAQDLLASMAPNAQQKVIQEFAPRDASRDVNAIFLKFAQGISQNTPRVSVPMAPLHRAAPGSGLPQHRLQQQPVPRQQPVGADTEAMMFLERWNLGTEAHNVFFSLLPEQQEKVKVEFNPRDTSSDANNIFVRFCQGIARGTAKGKGGHPGGLGARFAPYG